MVYAGTNTVYISSSGNFDSAPEGSQNAQHEIGFHRSDGPSLQRLRHVLEVDGRGRLLRHKAQEQRGLQGGRGAAGAARKQYPAELCHSPSSVDDHAAIGGEIGGAVVDHLKNHVDRTA